MRYLLLLASLSLCNCRPSPVTNIAKESRTVIIQPYNGISEKTVNYVYEKLLSYCPGIKLKSPVPLPATAYYPARNRFRADSLIHILARHTNDHSITIGLTNVDISVTKGEQKDWGVMGLADCPGSACIASSYRLSKQLTEEQLFKVSIHELGHTEGLPHCKQIGCYMQDAEGTNKTDQLHEFCSACKKHLLQRGWTLDKRTN